MGLRRRLSSRCRGLPSSLRALCLPPGACSQGPTGSLIPQSYPKAVFMKEAFLERRLGVCLGPGCAGRPGGCWPDAGCVGRCRPCSPPDTGQLWRRASRARVRRPRVAMGARCLRELRRKPGARRASITLCGMSGHGRGGLAFSAVTLCEPRHPHLDPRCPLPSAQAPSPQAHPPLPPPLCSCCPCPAPPHPPALPGPPSRPSSIPNFEQSCPTPRPSSSP